MKKTLFKVLLFAGCFTLLKSFCEKQTDGFTLLRISSSLPYEQKWDIPPLSSDKLDHLHKLFSQKFYYLGAGGQCYAFVSQDNETVLKFFKFHMRTPSYQALLPFLPRFLKTNIMRKNDRASKRLLRDFNSYKLAYEELKEETALLYIHLNKSSFLKQSVIIVDKLGIEHRIDLDDKEFIVQKKMELVHPRLQFLMQSNKLEEAKQAIDSLLEVVVARCKKGIFDEDARLHRNFGFIGPNAAILDVGRFRRDENRRKKEVYLQDIDEITFRFRNWLSNTYPELSCYLEKRLQELHEPMP